jgi:hypothetical protein
MKYLRFFGSFEINESKREELFDILKKESKPELEAYIAKHTREEESKLKSLLPKIAKYTAPGSTHESEKLFGYIKKKAKEGKIEIDMKEIDKWVEASKGGKKDK